MELGNCLWAFHEAQVGALFHCTFVFHRHNVLLIHCLRSLGGRDYRKKPVRVCCRYRLPCFYLGFYGLHTSKEVEADNLGLGLLPRGALLRNDLRGSRNGIYVHSDRSFCHSRTYSVARMLVPKFVCKMSRTSLLTIHFVREAYNSTLSHTKKEFGNTLARWEFLALSRNAEMDQNAGCRHSSSYIDI